MHRNNPKSFGLDEIRIDGRSYVQHSCWTFGDYGGFGSIGLANIRAIEAECEGHVIECPANDLQHVSEGCPYGLAEDTRTEIRTERPWAIKTYGSYSHESIWVRKPVAMRLSSHGYRGRTWAQQMESYPSLDDDGSTEIEMQWEMEAWESWLKSDLIRSLNADDDSQDEVEALGNDALFEAYREAMEATSTQAVPEYSGVHVDVDRIKDKFAEIVYAMLDR